jgi:hypothetical protein
MGRTEKLTDQSVRLPRSGARYKIHRRLLHGASGGAVLLKKEQIHALNHAPFPLMGKGKITASRCR